ncbi:hypothetical protein [Leifsonia poae]|uniref:hypothetical protein n=1 Tax=Leifsonia poae TaxID=110933 RepID=UPI001CC123A7|nr:hypothetical protein [Leifsonia poae]
MTEFDVEVRTRIPAARFKTLVAIAARHNTTVGALVAEITRRAVTGDAVAPKRKGRPSKYTRHLGERILDARRFGRPYTAIGVEEHLSVETVKRYAQRAAEEGL